MTEKKTNRPTRRRVQPIDPHEREFMKNHTTRYPVSLYKFVWSLAGAEMRSFNQEVMFILQEYAYARGYDPKKSDEYPEPHRFQRTPAKIKKEELYRRNKLLMESGYAGVVDFVSQETNNTDTEQG
jgi:hypothetical protein